MADLTAQIETMENQYMRAWAQGDLPALKALTGSGFHLLIGSKPAAMLDRPSWLEAATKRFVCNSYRFGDIYVRNLGSTVLFASQVELKATVAGFEWNGRMWVTDLWRKGRVRRRWRLIERVLSRVEEERQVPAGIKAMQLWGGKAL
jgi:hypothetical protein